VRYGVSPAAADVRGRRLSLSVSYRRRALVGSHRWTTRPSPSPSRASGWWAVELREPTEVVGWVGAFFRETSPHLEVGWTFRPKFWRQGFATEAARAALAYGIEKYDARRVIAHIANANVASVKVSQNLGMRYEADIPFFDDVVGLYALER
jgi:RimJ/RimL family protein N-acetyltransferase